jgi:glycosyltransferase involved in cell wall biosynthesis
VEIVAELKNHFPSIKAMLCGDGEDKDRLQKMIEEKSCKIILTMTGMLQHTAVLKLMQRSKILLHPSSYEGFGIVCIEALYAGRTL